MSQGDSNPAAVPHAAEDVQGDGRWMSQVRPGGCAGRFLCREGAARLLSAHSARSRRLCCPRAVRLSARGCLVTLK